MEPFFKTLKGELPLDRKYESRTKARQEIFKFIELYYATRRPHSSLGNLSPLKYERQSEQQFDCRCPGNCPTPTLPPQPSRVVQPIHLGISEHHRPFWNIARQCFKRGLRLPYYFVLTYFLARVSPIPSSSPALTLSDICLRTVRSVTCAILATAATVTWP